MVSKIDKFVEQLLNLSEGQLFEFKRAKIKPRDALVPIIAMANADGGWFVIGLEDPEKATGKNRLYGISENIRNVEELLNTIPREITPPILNIQRHKIPIINKQNKNDELFILDIPKSPKVHSSRSGDTYLRIGRSNKKLTAEEIIQLKYAKGEIHVEDEPAPNVELEELDRNLLNEFRNTVLSEEKDVWLFLRKSGLAVQHKGKLVLNKAAVLLFGENPSVSLRYKYGIKISIYYGKEAYFTDRPNLATKPITLEGPLIKQIWDSFEYIRSWLKRSAPILEGATFRERYHYPDYAIQEAITNAVLHRDYSIQNDIQVRIFDNRIEFESPGGLPGHITLSNIKQERFARNPIILRTLNRFPHSPNLDIGEGVKRMFEAMKHSNLIDPVYYAPKERPLVGVILYHEERAPYWERVSEFLDIHGKITNKDLRSITGIQDTVRVSRILQRWVSWGLLAPKGGGKRDRHYVKSESKDLISLFKGINHGFAQ